MSNLATDLAAAKFFGSKYVCSAVLPGLKNYCLFSKLGHYSPIGKLLYKYLGCSLGSEKEKNSLHVVLAASTS